MSKDKESNNFIPFNKPYFSGNEVKYISDGISIGDISGNGKYTKLCHSFFENKYNFKKCLLTNSCTTALEMAAILLDIKPGDEVIMPSYTFVSTPNAFILRGAKIIFCDSKNDNPCIDEDLIEGLISKKTKAIVPVHYAGFSCNMEKIISIAKKYDLFVVEDAAQAIDNYYIDSDKNLIPIGTQGHLSTFSFHESKNIICGEGGMLVINEERFINRSEIIWEKGTDRAAFWRGEVDKYLWHDIGSSFLPSEITAAFLYSQLENLGLIQKKRKEIWNNYMDSFTIIKDTVRLPSVPEYCKNNAHMFYLICKDSNECLSLNKFLKSKNIYSAFHYHSLHSSPFFKDKHDGRKLTNCDKYAECLIRFPIYYELNKNDQQKIIDSVIYFFTNIQQFTNVERI